MKMNTLIFVRQWATARSAVGRIKEILEGQGAKMVAQDRKNKVGSSVDGPS